MENAMKQLRNDRKHNEMIKKCWKWSQNAKKCLQKIKNGYNNDEKCHEMIENAMKQLRYNRKHGKTIKNTEKWSQNTKK